MSSGTMTDRMLEWSIQHHEATGENRFKLDRKFRRAAAQQYCTTWLVGMYWENLIPPNPLEPYASYWISVELESEATNE